MKTLTKIIGSKILESIESMSLAEMAAFGGKIVMASFFAFGAIDIASTLEIIENVAKWNDFVILRTVSVFVAVYSFQKWWTIAGSLLESFIQSLQEPEEKDESEILLKGIPVSEIADYMFEHGNLPRNEICSHFGITRSTSEYIINGLDSVGVFTRGPNNARILDERFSRADIINILSRASTQGVFRIFRKTETGFTHSPEHNFIRTPLYQ